MQKKEITKVVISQEDIQNAIHNELAKQGLMPIGKININISRRSVGFGHAERDEWYISDTIVECEKVK